MNLKTFIESTISATDFGDGLKIQKVRPRIHTKDGFSLSVQASDFTYCSPRCNFLSEYYEVEVGYPSERVEELMPYAEDSDEPTQTVYGYVPIEIVSDVIEKHGGIDVEKTFADKQFDK